MAKLESFTVRTQTKYVFVLIPFATYTRVGEIALLAVFGVPVYKRVGKAWSLFGTICHAS